MSHDFSDRAYSDKQLDELVEQLNALFPRHSAWEHTRAAKAHEDHFGARISPGDMYFKRQAGAGYHEVVKLSRLSMDRLIFALRCGNPVYSDVAEHLQALREKDRHEQGQRTAAILSEFWKPKA